MSDVDLWPLPAGWEWRNLEEIAPASAGQILPTKFPNRDFRYLSLDSLPSGGWTEPEPNHVTGTEVRSNCIQFDASHVLYAKLRPYLNKVVVPTQLGIATTEFVPLVPNQDVITREYLAWYLRSPQFVEYAIRNSTGARMPRVRMTDFWAASVPVPPLEMQHRIVAHIEAAFARLTEARRLHESIVQETGSLLGAAMAEAFSPHVTSNWTTRTVDEIFEIRGGKRLPKGELFAAEETPYPYLRVVDFSHGTIDSTNLKYLPPEIHAQIARYTISKDDVYISIAGTIGLVGTIPEILDGANLTENAAKLVFRAGFKPQIDKRFLVYYLSSPPGQSQIGDRAKAAGQPKLALIRIATIEISYPGLEEQRRIVAYLDSVQAQVAALRSAQAVTAADLTRLEESMLARAFRGEL